MAVGKRQRESVVKNFRPAGGLKSFYRCSDPDELAGLVEDGRISEQLLPEPERVILYDATLIVDLRSFGEVDQAKHQTILQHAPGGPFEQIQTLEEMKRSLSRRQVLAQGNNGWGFNKADLAAYVEKQWLTPQQLEGVDENKRRDIMMQALNKQGLAGLLEAVLETKPYIATIMKAITIHLEKCPEGKVVFHCSLGKDRTGVIAMLCQALLGMTDDRIVEDFTKSSAIRDRAQETYKEIFQGKLDVAHFGGASEETMRLTLKHIRTKYGSLGGYLSSTGFDESWQNRFSQVAV